MSQLPWCEYRPCVRHCPTCTPYNTTDTPPYGPMCHAMRRPDAMTPMSWSSFFSLPSLEWQSGTGWDRQLAFFYIFLWRPQAIHTPIHTPIHTISHTHPPFHHIAHPPQLLAHGSRESPLSCQFLFSILYTQYVDTGRIVPAQPRGPPSVSCACAVLDGGRFLDRMLLLFVLSAFEHGHGMVL